MAKVGLRLVSGVGFLVLVNAASPSDYGTTGLIDTPTARFDKDGVFSVSASTDERHKQYSITYQATPWLQGTFRYTGFAGTWDRNYEFKARLLSETANVPQVAVGIRDIVGTGIFESEYLVASKQFNNTDISLGLGWGRLAGDALLRNPLIQLDDRFGNRAGTSGVGGQFSVGNYFSGKHVGVFGGVRHELTDLPVSVMLEYNPDRYLRDIEGGGEEPRSALSAGLTYHISPDLDVTFSLQHGDEVGIGFRASLDSTAEKSAPAPESFISSFYLDQSQLPPQISKKSWYDRLLYDTERSGLILVEGTVSDDGLMAQLVVGNAKYGLWTDAISSHIALADLHLPASVRTLQLVVEDAGHRVLTLSLPRPSSYYSQDDEAILRQLKLLSGRTLEQPQYRTGFYTGKVSNSLNLKTRFQLFDPDDPARYQLFIELGSEFAINNYWALRAAVAFDLDNNFDESKRLDSGSQLDKVRSDVVRYLIEGESGLEKLILDGRNTLGRHLHYRLFAGYLETMYAGAGGEVLFWPSSSRVAVGASLAFVRQRDFDREWGLQPYKVATGHLSAYWASPFYDFDVAIHGGRYLAGDIGATLELRRTFRNGWQVGVWATFTDVPFEVFGEGAFDKGMYFQIPLDGILGRSSRNLFSTRVRPIQRDGGQRLDGYSGDIFWDLRRSRYDSFNRESRVIP